MKKIIISLFLFLSISFASEKIYYFIGINGDSSFDITDNDNNEIASVEEDIPNIPIDIGIRSSTSFFSESDSGWGYFIESGFAIFYIGEQRIEENEYIDYGTSVKGASIHITPTLVYQASSFPFIAGIGVGIGALYADGSYIITKKDHPEYQNRKDIDISKIDMSILINLEFFIIPDELSFGLRSVNVTAGDNYNQRFGGFFGRFYF